MRLPDLGGVGAGGGWERGDTNVSTMGEVRSGVRGGFESLRVRVTLAHRKRKHRYGTNQGCRADGVVVGLTPTP